MGAEVSDMPRLWPPCPYLTHTERVQAGDYRYFDTRFAAMAHRGGFLSEADRPRENTLYAFTRAAERGYRYLETDVHVSVDGVLFAFHDNTLDRVTNATGVPERLPWRELSQVRIAGIDPIPRFDELLEALPEASEPVLRWLDVLARWHGLVGAEVPSAGAARRIFGRAVVQGLRAAEPVFVLPMSVLWSKDGQPHVWRLDPATQTVAPVKVQTAGLLDEEEVAS